MLGPRQIRFGCLLVALSASSIGCSTETDTPEATNDTPQAINPGQCNRAQPKDILIAGLVKDSWLAGYPLTRLSIDANGSIVGANLPPILVGDLEIINSVPEARTSVQRALRHVSGLPEYGMNGLGPDTEACTSVPAWTPTGTTTVATSSNQVFPSGVNAASWRTTHLAFGVECPLVMRIGNRDIVDPPGDGSTNSPASATVSSTGVTANAFGICPAGTLPGTYCKLSYATGVNYSGRTCQYYYGSLRCLLY